VGVEGVDGIAYGLIVAATAIGNLASALPTAAGEQDVTAA